MARKTGVHDKRSRVRSRFTCQGYRWGGDKGADRLEVDEWLTADLEDIVPVQTFLRLQGLGHHMASHAEACFAPASTD